MVYMILTATSYYAVTLSQFITGNFDSQEQRYLKASQINPEFLWSFFKLKNLPYNLRKGPIVNTNWVNLLRYNALHFKGSHVWKNLTAKVKSSYSVFELKTQEVKDIEIIDCGF